MRTLRDCAPKIVTLLLVTVIVSGCSPAAKRFRVLQRADHYFKSGDYDKAKIEYLNLLRLDCPRTPTLLTELNHSLIPTARTQGRRQEMSRMTRSQVATIEWNSQRRDFFV
jgi:hypothetical protein